MSSDDAGEWRWQWFDEWYNFKALPSGQCHRPSDGG